MKNLVFVIVLLAWAALGCKMFGSSSESNTSTGANRTSTETAPAKSSSTGDPKADLIAASKKFGELPMFKVVMDLKSAQNMRIEMEYIAPDRFHMKNGSTMDIIAIGSNTYMKTGGKWQKVQVNMADSISKMRDSFNEEGIKSLDSVEIVGEENINGKDAIIYSSNGTLPADGKKYKSKTWVSKSDGLPIKIEVVYAEGDLKHMTTNYDTDSKITIDAPID